MAAVPADFHFVAFHGVLTWPVVGTAIRKAGHLTVNRDDRAARVACARAMTDTLRRGDSLLVFPEGSANRSPDLLPFRLGAFRTAVEAGRPIVPMTLEGTGAMLPPGGWLMRPGPLSLSIHARLDPVANSRGEMSRLRREARLAMGPPPSGAHQNVRRTTHSRKSESTMT
jgi:1-acyl-sn-glycerol-3-phosphate acyltransferase